MRNRGLDGQGANGVNVRKARPEDAAEILKLVIALAHFEKLDPPDEAAQQRLMADAFGPHPRFEIFLAEVEAKVVGYAFVFETYSTFLALPTLYLEDLFVLPEYRKRKAGYALFLHCAQEAARREFGRMEWTVLDWNEYAINFYKRLGAKHLPEWHHYRLDRSDLERLSSLE